MDRKRKQKPGGQEPKLLELIQKMKRKSEEKVTTADSEDSRNDVSSSSGNEGLNLDDASQRGHANAPAICESLTVVSGSCDKGHDGSNQSVPDHVGDARASLGSSIGKTNVPRRQSGQLKRQCSVPDPTPLAEGPYQPTDSVPPPWTSDGKGAQRTVRFQTKWYKTYPWLTYFPASMGVMCFICQTAFKEQLFRASSRIEPAFTQTGFKNWNNATTKFTEHEKSQMHLEAVEAVAVWKMEKPSILSCVVKANSDAYMKNRKALYTIFTTLQYLAKQGVPIQGDEDLHSNFMQLLHLRCEDVSVLKPWLERSKNYTSHDIQNEILEMMAHSIQRNILLQIKTSEFFSLIADETTDISTKEQLSISVRGVKDNLEPYEVFLGQYEADSTTGESLASILEDTLIRFDLPLDRLRGQCFDGASNMKGKFKGVQARLKRLLPLALYVHCHNHCLNLALQDAVRSVPVMRDVLQYSNDVSVLLGRSAKRLVMFDNIANDPDLELGTSVHHRLKPLCPTRWTVRVKCLQTIIENYPVILHALCELSVSKDHCNSTASGLYCQFEKYTTLFGIMTLKKLFVPCENLALALQNKNSTVSGSVEAAGILVSHLTDMRSEYASFKSSVDMLAEKFDQVMPTLPRKRKVPERFKKSGLLSATSTEADDVETYLLQLYMDTNQTLSNEINDRFDQPEFKKLAILEKFSTCHTDQDVMFEANKNVLKEFGFDAEFLKFQLKMFGKLGKLPPKTC